MSDLITDLTDATKSCLYLAFFDSPGGVTGDQEIKPDSESYCLYKTSLLYVSGIPSSATDPSQTLVKYEKDGVREGSEPVLRIVTYNPQKDILRALVDLGLKDKLKDQRELEEILRGVAVTPRQSENISVCWLWDAMKVSPFLLLHILLKADMLVLTESSWYQVLSEQDLIDRIRIDARQVFRDGVHLADGADESSSLSSSGMRKIRTLGALDHIFRIKLV